MEEKMENQAAQNNYQDPGRRGAKVLRIIGHVFMGILFAAAFALVFGLLVQVLWNWIMPAVFGLGEISYWQAFGIVILCKLLFGGFGPHRDHNRDHFHRKIESHFHRFGDRDHAKFYPPFGPHREWKNYRDFWKEEGHAAFEAFMDRREKKVEENKE
jgi:hypothetical protein